MDELRDALNKAGQAAQQVEFTVLRGEKTVVVAPMLPNKSVGNDRIGLGIVPGPDMAHPVIGGVLKGSPADAAGIAADDRTPAGAAVTAIDGQPVQSWFDVHRLLKQHVADKSAGGVKLTVHNSTGDKTFEFPIDQAQATAVNSILYSVPLMLREQVYVRKTSNPIEAAKWGVGETRDLIVQFYLTIKRMVQGSVPASGAMGPLGIVTAGAKFAYKGNDWLIWFLSMISANLAVVNFLPIPIVDGGLFTFLIIEKLQGKPISARTQSIAQVVGLALIASVFLFVTYHDILRMF
jgi:regulator of sigma E protease